MEVGPHKLYSQPIKGLCCTLIWRMFFFLSLFCLQISRSNKKRETTPCICLNRTVYDITQKLSAELCRVSNHDETVVDSSCSSNFCPPDVTKDDCVHFRKLHLDITATCFSPDLFLWLVTSCAVCLKGFIGWVDCSVIPLCTYIDYHEKGINDYLKLFFLIVEAKCTKKRILLLHMR